MGKKEIRINKFNMNIKLGKIIRKYMIKYISTCQYIYYIKSFNKLGRNY